MTGKELVQIIEEEGLEDYEFTFSTSHTDGRSKWGFTVHRYTINLEDIGHSDKVVILSGAKIE